MNLHVLSILHPGREMLSSQFREETQLRNTLEGAAQMAKLRMFFTSELPVITKTSNGLSWLICTSSCVLRTHSRLHFVP